MHRREDRELLKAIGRRFPGEHDRLGLEQLARHGMLENGALERLAGDLNHLTFYRRKRRELRSFSSPSFIFSVPSVAFCKMLWPRRRLRRS